MTLLTLTTPFYNNEKHLPEYFEGLLNLDYPKKMLNLLFADNGSTDQTKKVLLAFLQEHEHLYHSVKLLEVERHQTSDKNIQISHVMNALFKYSEPYDIVNIDSDIIPPPDTLWKLLLLRRLGADIATGITIVLRNTIPAPNVYSYKTSTGRFYFPNWLEFIDNKLALVFPREFFYVNACGSCLIFISRDVLNLLRFSTNQKEKMLSIMSSDVFFTFSATKLGLKILVDPTLIATHLSKVSIALESIITEDKVIIKTAFKKPNDPNIAKAWLQSLQRGRIMSFFGIPKQAATPQPQQGLKLT